MARADRLIDVIRVLRNGRLIRAEDLARRLNVSLRTIYRDLEALMASGLPVEGARGLGYRMTHPVTLPPLNLTLTELEALHLGLAIVGEGADQELQGAAETLSSKIDAVLPEDRDAPPAGWGFAVYPFEEAAKGFVHMPVIRDAVRSRQKLQIIYADRMGSESQRVIRPLTLEYWGRVWTTVVWCEASGTFQDYRIDRMRSVERLPSLFVEEDGKRLEDYLAGRD